MPINKLEQLRKYIFYNRNQKDPIRANKKKLLERLNLFQSTVYHARINRWYDSLIERNHKRGMLLPF